MGIQITAPLLASINAGVNLTFNTQLFAAESKYKAFSTETTSSGEFELYPRLDMIPGLREWIGERQVHSLSELSFQINNKTFEETLGIKRENIEDDKYGLLANMGASMLGENVGVFPDTLMAKLMKNGHTAPIYDGQNFFDTAHPTFAADGSATTVSNYGGGSGDPWFLIDNRRMLKPFIFQRRRPFTIIPRFNLTDPNVFDKNEFLWGVDGRCNAGYGLWQLVYMSKVAMTHDAVLAAKNVMASIRRPDGTPMGISPNLLVTTTANYNNVAKPLEVNDFQPGSSVIAEYSVSAPAALVPNLLKGTFKALEYEWLN